MDTETQSYELSNIHQEYKLYFEKCDLNFKSRLVRRNHISLKTLEKVDLNVSVDIGGWSSSGSSKQYETFEALMMDASPGFRSKFGNTLTDRLNDLLMTQFAPEEEYSEEEKNEEESQAEDQECEGTV